MEYGVEQLAQRLGEVPRDIRMALSTSKVADQVIEIADKHELLLTQTDTLARETTYVMLGLNHPNTFISILKEKLGLSQEDARSLAEDINQVIFQPVRDSLRKVHRISTGTNENGPATQEQVASPTPTFTDQTNTSAYRQTPPSTPATVQTTTIDLAPHREIETTADHGHWNKPQPVTQQQPHVQPQPPHPHPQPQWQPPAQPTYQQPPAYGYPPQQGYYLPQAPLPQPLPHHYTPPPAYYPTYPPQHPMQPQPVHPAQMPYGQYHNPTPPPPPPAPQRPPQQAVASQPKSSSQPGQDPYREPLI